MGGLALQLGCRPALLRIKGIKERNRGKAHQRSIAGGRGSLLPAIGFLVLGRDASSHDPIKANLRKGREEINPRHFPLPNIETLMDTGR